MAAYFSEAGLRFLRALKRNNDREWFGEHKGVYEAEVKAPMLEIVARVNDFLLDFAPQHVRPPHKAVMRIYRDIRFSKDKRPYKTHASAWWARDGLEKTSGAGFYLEVSGDAVTIAAGVYMPERTQLLAIRQHIAARHEDFRALLAAPELLSRFGMLEGAALKRSPKGFEHCSDAMDLLRCTQWGVSATAPTTMAKRAELAEEVGEAFRIAAPVMAFLNAPLLRRVARKALF